MVNGRRTNHHLLSVAECDDGWEGAIHGGGGHRDDPRQGVLDGLLHGAFVPRSEHHGDPGRHGVQRLGFLIDASQRQGQHVDAVPDGAVEGREDRRVAGSPQLVAPRPPTAWHAL